MSIDMTLKKWAIFIMGVYGVNSHFLSDPTEILFLVIKKTLTHIVKVSVRKKSNTKVIAKKPLTNLYEMNSKLNPGYIYSTYTGIYLRLCINIQRPFISPLKVHMCTAVSYSPLCFFVINSIFFSSCLVWINKESFSTYR